MKKLIITAIAAACTLLGGCVSISDINDKIQPVSYWYNKTYSESKESRSVKFDGVNSSTISKAVVATSRELKFDVMSADDKKIVLVGKVADVLDKDECEKYVLADYAESMQLSGGMYKLTCDKSQLERQNVMVDIKISDGVVSIDASTYAPTLSAYGLKLPTRPSPTAANYLYKKFFNSLRKHLNA